MILCRIFIGFDDLVGDEEGNVTFNLQGNKETLFVIDELAIKGYSKHANLSSGGRSDKIVRSEFREAQDYNVSNFIDKVVKPIIIQEHFGVRTTFAFSDDDAGKKALREFADAWVVAVNVPDGARSIPDGATGVLVPRPYEGNPPAATRISKGLEGLDINAETA